MEYEELIEKIIKLFESTKYVVLATSNKDGVVSASQMCLVNDDLKVYFQTDSSFEKVKNIKENPNVAINIGTFYFKGTAKVIGHPLSSSTFIEEIKTKHPSTYEKYTNLSSEVLIEVKLNECRIWGLNSKNIHNEDNIHILDFKTKKLSKIICNK